MKRIFIFTILNFLKVSFAFAQRFTSLKKYNIFTTKLSPNEKKEAFYVCFSLGLLILSSLTTNSISASIFLVFIGFQAFLGYRFYKNLQISKIRKFRQGKIWKFFLYGFLSCFSLIAGIILIFSTRFKSEPYKFTNVTANTVYITPLLNATPEDGFYRKASTVVFPFGIPITTNGGHSRTRVEPGKSITFDFDYESIRQAKHFLLVEKNENYYLLDALFFSSSISSGDLLEDKTNLQPANKAAVDKGNHTRYRLHIQLLLLLFLLTITLYFPYCWIKEFWFLIRNFIPLKIKMKVMKFIT